MSKLLVQVDWEDKDGELQTLTDVQRINIRKGADIKHNTLDITLTNKQNTSRPYIQADGSIAFEPEQQINVYVKYDSDGSGIDTTNDLLFAGRVVEFEGILDADKTQIKLKCSDSSFIALNKLWVGDETKTPPNLIIDVVNFINDTIDVEDNKITAALTTSSGKVQATDSDGNAFDTYTLARTFKPAYEVIQELSQPDATGDGEVPYRFHIDKNNELHWFYPDDEAAHVLKAGQTSAQTATYSHPVTNVDYTTTDSNNHDVINYKLKRAVYDVTNFIIYKAGEDLNGNQILDFEYDATSGSPVLKDSFRSWEDIARSLKSSEAEAGNISKVQGDEYQIDNTTGTTSWEESYSSTSDYNEKFRNRAILLGDGRAQSEFKYTGSPRWKGKIELKGTRLFDANDGVVFSSDVHGIEPEYFRVEDVQHNVSKSGWFTTLQLEQEVEDKS